MSAAAAAGVKRGEPGNDPERAMNRYLSFGSRADAYNAPHTIADADRDEIDETEI
jgi:hypothetical protein